MESGVDVAADILHAEITAKSQDLGLPARAASSYHRSSGELPQACGLSAGDECVAVILSFGDCADFEAFGDSGRHILHAVNRKVDLARQQGLIDLLYENANS